MRDVRKSSVCVQVMLFYMPQLVSGQQGNFGVWPNQPAGVTAVRRYILRDKCVADMWYVVADHTITNIGRYGDTASERYGYDDCFQRCYLKSWCKALLFNKEQFRCYYLGYDLRRVQQSGSRLIQQHDGVWRYAERQANVDVCLNGGTCAVLQESPGFECRCRDGYVGDHCQIDKNECILVDDEVNPACKNGGTCVFSRGQYVCLCRSLWTGKYCAEAINFCEQRPSPCRHRGSCVNINPGYECKCAKGWAGRNCTEPSSCLRKPCKNGATCVDTDDEPGYLCQCTEGFKGQHCVQPCYPDSDLLCARYDEPAPTRSTIRNAGAKAAFAIQSLSSDEVNKIWWLQQKNASSSRKGRPALSNIQAMLLYVEDLYQDMSGSNSSCFILGSDCIVCGWFGESCLFVVFGTLAGMLLALLILTPLCCGWCLTAGKKRKQPDTGNDGNHGDSSKATVQNNVEEEEEGTDRASLL